MLKRLSGFARWRGELEARGAEAVERLTKPGGAVDQAQAIVSLARAVADGLADELVQRLPFGMLYTPKAKPVSSWQPPEIVHIDPLSTMTVVALKDEARRRGISFNRRIRKSDLIALLRRH